MFSLTLDEAATALLSNRVVAIPTETVYGLAGNAFCDEAIHNIFHLKGRPSDNPLIVHVPTITAAQSITGKWSNLTLDVAGKLWPGPLTIVLPVTGDNRLSKFVTAGLNTVGIRIPNHPITLKLLNIIQIPLAAPSANLSGSPSPTTAGHVTSDFGASVGVLDGGPCEIGLESTVIKIIDEEIHILRPGKITKEIFQSHGWSVSTGNTACKEGNPPEAPGMKYRHYAPKGKVVLLFDNKMHKELVNSDTEYTAWLVFDDFDSEISRNRFSLGVDANDLNTASNRLFDLLRKCDDLKISMIFIDCRFNQNQGIGVALFNRISKAASKT
jgi:L-threonylcarbamoyladenylate synthase